MRLENKLDTIEIKKENLALQYFILFVGEPYVVVEGFVWLGSIGDVYDCPEDEVFVWSGWAQDRLRCTSLVSSSAFVDVGFLHTGLGRDGERNLDLCPSKD